jgi:hypothetical protein
MSLLSLHLLGSPVLRQHSAEVKTVDDETRRLVADLFETMDAARGVGLAANQVGQDLSYDNDRTISVAGMQACIYWHGTEITFPNPYSDQPATVTVDRSQPPSVVAAVVEAVLTTFAMHLAFVAVEAAEVHLLDEEVD